MRCGAAGDIGDAALAVFVDVHSNLPGKPSPILQLFPCNKLPNARPKDLPSIHPIPTSPSRPPAPTASHNSKQMILTRKLLLGIQLLKVSVTELVSADEPSVLGITNIAINICQLDQANSKDMSERGRPSHTPGSQSLLAKTTTYVICLNHSLNPTSLKCLIVRAKETMLKGMF